jgi:hypothetical protein
MTTRLKIDLAQGVLEVEGSETFVKAIYSDFKVHFVEPNGVAEESALLVKAKRGRKPKLPPALEASPSIAPLPEIAPPPLPEPPEVVAVAPVLAQVEPQPDLELKAKPVPPTSTYKFIEDLHLEAAGGHPALVEFMDAKLPITNEERNLVFLYYLQYTLKIKSITLDHVYTCYRGAKIRAPLNMENSLRITAEQHGWIKTTQNGNLSVTPEGKQYVEKQLPKKKKT